MTQDELVAHYADKLTRVLRERFGSSKLSKEPGEGLVTSEEIQEVAWPIVEELHDALYKLLKGPVRLNVSMDKETRDLYIECKPEVAERIAGLPRTRKAEDTL